MPSTMPAIPGSVRVAPSTLSAPSVSTTLRASAAFATSPHGPYSASMKANTRPKPASSALEAARDGIGAEIGPNGALLDHGERRWQRSGPQKRG